MTRRTPPETETPPATPEPAPEPEAADPRSDFEEGVDHLGRAFGGVMTRLFGERVTGQPLDPEKPVLGPDADRVVVEIGDTVGRWLHAAGRSMKDTPTRPVKVLDETMRRKDDDVPVREGETSLTAGLRSLAGGMVRTTEAVLDKVVPRKPKTTDSGAPPSGNDAEGETTE